MSKYFIDTLRPIVKDKRPTLLHKIGFEERSLVSVAGCPDFEWNQILTLASTDRSEKARLNLATLQKSLSERGVSLNLVGELNQSDPLETQTALSAALNSVVSAWSEGELWIDFTALRREELLILVRLLLDRFDRSTLDRIYGLYVSARKMGEWLSGDVVDIRSVVGFPGEISPARSTTLIALMGFEINRARAIIESYEPSNVLLGIPSLEGSINHELYSRNQEVLRKVSEDFRPLISGTFEFSANDPTKAFNDLSKVVSECLETNIILAPLHTKLSTLAVGAVGRSDPRIQICYAAVDEYNEETYSQPSGEFYLVPFSFMPSGVS
ncbi:MAG: hypothetical protein LCH61_00935 [Proteobacteria bacterium]|nr:hypothetical protein [Pseudomonadota bacterium]